MLLQYPKVSDVAEGNYQDYRKKHHHFVWAYQAMHEDVARFSLIPEKFIKEVEPAIEGFLREFEKSHKTPPEKEQLNLITDFISGFYDFMNEVTEMFTEHQAFSEQTIEYMAAVSEITQRNPGKEKSEYEDEYVHLLPDVEKLSELLYSVRVKVDGARADLEALKPEWDRIKNGLLKF